MSIFLLSLGRRLVPIVYAVSALCLAESAAADDPKVFWASDPVKPGQTVQVSGMGLAAVEKVEITTLSDHPEDRAELGLQQAKVLAKTDSTLSFLLPGEFRPGVFSVTLRTGGRASSFQLNAPDVYWMQGDRGLAASSGGWLRLSGRNMAMTDKAMVRMAATGGRETEIQVARPDSWSASFAIPEDMPNGSYRVLLWNGTGDASAWRDAGTIEIVQKQQTVRPVMELFGNHSDSADHDDTARINAAMEALARRGGGTLLLHFGIYRLSGTLHIPDGVSLKGEANDLVTLAWKDTETPPDALIQGFSDFSLEDLTVNAQRHFHIVKGGFDLTSGEPGGKNIAIRRVIIRATAFMGHLKGDQPRERLEPMQRAAKDGVAGLLLTGSNILVEGCDILSSMRPFLLTDAVGARLTDNIFRIGRLGWYGISGSDGVLFENNRLVGADLQATGGGINTLDGSASVRNVLVRNNRFETMFGWDREAVTSDGPRGYYHGVLTSVQGRSVRIDATGLGLLKDRDWKGASLFVLKGRGTGLMARIVERAGDGLELDRDIAEMTDDTSVVSIVPDQENFLIIGNSFEDTGAAQIFGTGYKHVFADNRALRSYGYVATSLNYLHPQPNFYIQFLGNEAKSAALLGSSGINVTGRQYDGNDTLLTFGIVIRGNRLRSGTSIVVNGRSAASPAVRNVLVEQNEIDHADVGISIGPGVEELILRDNVTSDVRVPVKQPVR